MKAPDKIYIQTNAGEAFSSKWTTIPFRDFENTEYIRKDALLEWAKEKQYESLTIVADNFWQEVIDKLNSL